MSNYTIKWGDTLSDIARRNNTDVDTLMSLNPYITNANKIYAGKNLVLPDSVQQVTQQQANTQIVTPTTSTPTNISQLAQEYANQQTTNTGSDTQALLNQYEKIAEQQKQALQNQQQLTTNQINSQRDNVLETYNNNARQAYINSMLGKKEVEKQLSQAGLNTSGLVGSAYANVENAYGNNLANLQNARDNSIKDIDNQLTNAQIQYAIEQNRLLADIENAKLELQKYGNQLAYQKYQDALDNYMKFANYDYQKAIDDRNYNYQVGLNDRNYFYQKERDAVADDQWKKEYDLALRKANSSGSSGGSSGSNSTIDYSFTDNSNNTKSNNTTQTITLDDILKNLKITQNVTADPKNPGKNIYDSYSGKYFSSPEEVIKYWTSMGK